MPKFVQNPEFIPIGRAYVPIGKEYERLTVLGRAAPNPRSHDTAWYCRCSCDGKIIWVRASDVEVGKTQSCGCIRDEKLVARRLKHGQASYIDTPEYISWGQMKSRCLKSTNKNFPSYGGRGITICDRWLGTDGFQNFFSDMGHRPSLSHSLDRIDVDGNYEPLNCRWATPKEQVNNRRIKRIENFSEKTFAQEAIKRGYIYESLVPEYGMSGC